MHTRSHWRHAWEIKLGCGWGTIFQLPLSGYCSHDIWRASRTENTSVKSVPQNIRIRWLIQGVHIVLQFWLFQTRTSTNKTSLDSLWIAGMRLGSSTIGRISSNQKCNLSWRQLEYSKQRGWCRRILTALMASSQGLWKSISIYCTFVFSFG